MARASQAFSHNEIKPSKATIVRVTDAQDQPSVKQTISAVQRLIWKVQLGGEDATTGLLDLDVIVAGSAGIGRRHNGGKPPATVTIGELIARRFRHCGAFARDLQKDSSKSFVGDGLQHRCCPAGRRCGVSVGDRHKSSRRRCPHVGEHDHRRYQRAVARACPKVGSASVNLCISMGVVPGSSVCMLIPGQRIEGPRLAS
jgi:hypothetical protein